MPEDVYALDYAPYSWLFPRMAAVVHHGGAGTTGAALRAGVPSLVVPFLFDQFFWGRRLQALRVGPAPYPFKKLSATTLAQAIRRMVEDRDMQRRAATLGAKIRAEDGLARAVVLVEEYGC
jgi:UDP:flavonoid glycosyltransferase YjiC (YdhE family)